MQEEQEVEGGEEAVRKPVRKSEAHQRLKECNRQRRSLAGAPPMLDTAVPWPVSISCAAYSLHLSHQ